MENLIQFLLDNWEILTAIAVVALGLAQKGSSTVNALIVKLMLFAEKQATAQFAKKGLLTGEEKKKFVIDYVYSKIPSFLHFLITKEYIAKKLENIIGDLKDIQDDGKLNASN